MAVQFRCSNIISYNAEAAEYVRCNCELTAPDSEIAKVIRCPNCHARVLVPPSTEPPSSAAELSANSLSVASKPETRRAAPPTIDSSTPLSVSTFDAKTRCTRCGGALNAEFRCVVCGHQSYLKADGKVVAKKQVRLAGCQLWLSQKLTHGINGQHLILAAHSFMGIVLLILVIGAFGIGGASAWVILVAVALIAGCYAYVVHEFRRIARKPPARLNFWQRGLWNVVLHFSRLRKWRSPNPGQAWRVLDVRNKPYDDQYLTSLPRLTAYQVLDLEGTALSDSGLLKFQGLKGLQRLVVRRTRVSHEGVFVLQQKLPQVWIWN